VTHQLFIKNFWNTNNHEKLASNIGM
jgi:hypothetical protein